MPVSNAPTLVFLISCPKRKAFFVGKRSARAIENVFEIEGDVMRVEGVHCEETWPKDVAIVRVKAVPKLDVAILFCQVAGVGEGVTVVLKRPVVLKHVIFAIHLHSGGIFDEIA
jgi:hypothetical protein